MKDDKWRSKIYEPYLEAWKILKLIQYAQAHGTDAAWEAFGREYDRLKDLYPENPFVECLRGFLHDASYAITKMNGDQE